MIIIMRQLTLGAVYYDHFFSYAFMDQHSWLAKRQHHLQSKNMTWHHPALSKSTIWDIIWVSLQRHNLLPLSRHFFCRCCSDPIQCANCSAETTVVEKSQNLVVGFASLISSDLWCLLVAKMAPYKMVTMCWTVIIWHVKIETDYISWASCYS